MILADNEAVFPLGMYDQPRGKREWGGWKEAGINLLRCSDEEELDSARKKGMMAWVPVPLICRNAGDEKDLGERIRSHRDNPAVRAWEGQDEAIWNACRLDDGIVTNRIWAQAPKVKAEIRSRLDALVDEVHPVS
jgi:hypothetical protein